MQQQQKKKKNRDRESFKHPKLFFTHRMQANTTRTHPTKPIMLRNKNIPSLLCNSSSTTELFWKSSTTTRDSSTSFLTKKSHSKPFTRAVSPVFPKSQDLWIDHHNYYMHSLKTNSDLPTTTKKKKKKKKTQH
jgi:hypothetical protein